MNRNFSKELENTRNRLSAVMQAANPTKEFGANLILAMVGLHLLAKKINRTLDLEERRCLTHEFNQGRSAMEKCIRALQENVPGKSAEKRLAVHSAVP
jgi:hypothetical protein